MGILRAKGAMGDGDFKFRRRSGPSLALLFPLPFSFVRFLAWCLVRFRALEDIIDPFYEDDVPRQHGGPWRQSFRDLEQSRSAMPVFGSNSFEKLLTRGALMMGVVEEHEMAPGHFLTILLARSMAVLFFFCQQQRER